MKNRIQTIKDVLYVSEMRENLLSIIVLNRQGFKIRFSNINVKIMQKTIEIVIAEDFAKNGLY